MTRMAVTMLLTVAQTLMAQVQELVHSTSSSEVDQTLLTSTCRVQMKYSSHSLVTEIHLPPSSMTRRTSLETKASE